MIQLPTISLTINTAGMIARGWRATAAAAPVEPGLRLRLRRAKGILRWWALPTTNVVNDAPELRLAASPSIGGPPSPPLADDPGVFDLAFVTPNNVANQGIVPTISATAGERVIVTAATRQIGGNVLPNAGPAANVEAAFQADYSATEWTFGSDMVFWLAASFNAAYLGAAPAGDYGFDLTLWADLHGGSIN